jgi:flagellar assembly factor FliW
VRVDTTRFGVLEVSEEEVFTFPQGIPGFENSKEYILLPASEEEKSPFFFLQSVAEKELSLFLLDPFQMFGDYDVEIDNKVIEALHIKSENDVLLFTTVTVNSTLNDSTTNMKAPIVLNVKEKLGAQIILEKNDYIIKQPLSV